MRKQILMIGAALLFTLGSTTFIACGNSNHEENESNATETTEAVESSEEVTNHAQFHCPMSCEEEKTYDEAGACPKCNMDLVVVE